jgi:hypothetical protein
MPLPVAERLSLEAILAHYCEKRVPLHVRDRVQMSFRIEGNAVTLFEKRPRYDNRSIWLEIDIAKFRYVVDRKQWVLFWGDSRRRKGWHRYEEIRPSRSIEPLLAEVDQDPTHIFWG